MDLVSKATEIGKELAQSSEFMEYKKLHETVYKDEKNKDMIDDFRRKILDYELKKQENKATDEDFKNLQNLQNILSLNPEVSRFLFSETSFSMKLQEVFQAIEQEIKLD